MCSVSPLGCWLKVNLSPTQTKPYSYSYNPGRVGYSGPDRIYGSTCSQHAAFSTSSPSPLSTTPNVKALARWTAGKRFTYRLLRTQTTPYTPVTLCLRVRKFAYILSCIFCCCCSVYILEVHTWYVFSSEISPPRMPVSYTHLTLPTICSV